MLPRATSVDRRRNAERRQRIAKEPSHLEADNEELRARHRQQAAVASIGLHAIRDCDLTTLMDEAAAVTATTLGIEYTIIAHLLPAGQSFVTRSGVGWRNGIVGGIASALGTPAEYLLRADEPIVIADVATESRFPIPTPMIEHGVISAIYAIIRGRVRPWGFLGAYATRPRAFNADDIGFLESVANVLALAVERHDLEVAQRREQEILQAVFDNIPVMISYYDSSGRLLRANREWQRTLGWTLEEAQRVDIVVEACPDPEIRKKALEFMHRAERRWADFQARTRDGRVIDTSWAHFKLSDGSRIGFGLDLTERKREQAERDRLVEEARASHVRTGALSRRLLTAHEEERRRLAVELHDELGQVLTAVKINLESLARSFASGAAPAQLNNAIGSVDQAMHSVRDLALDLRPAVLDDLGLPPALRWYADRFARDAQVEVHVSIDAVPDLEPGIATACFRVAQEALTNVARHAQARHVWLELHLLADGVGLLVRDDGVGFDAPAARQRATQGASIGLLGMQERVSLAGGDFEIRSSAGDGTEVRARFAVTDKPRKTA